jgi:hypothetical protein
MRFVPSNLPDAVWSRLKGWAKTQALVEETPTNEQCRAQVRQAVAEFAGDRDALRPDVVAFYAAEALEMIAKFRQDRRTATDPDVEAAV